MYFVLKQMLLNLISWQIAEVVDAFRNKLSVYKVVVVRNVNAGPPQRRLIQQNEHQAEMGPPGEPVRSSGRKRKAVRRYEDELLEGRPMNDMAEEEDPLEVPSSSIAGPESDFIFTMPQQVNENLNLLNLFI